MGWIHRLAAATTMLMAASGCAQNGHVGAPAGPAVAMPDPGTSATAAAAQGTGDWADRLIAPDDLLEVSIFEAPELNRVVRVSQGGDISLPLLGVTRAAGKAARELEVSLQDQLRRSYIHDPHVSVQVKELGTPPIYVVGEVAAPGAFVPSGRTGLTVLRAVALAKGLKPTAAHKRAVVIRTAASGERQQIALNLNDIVSGKQDDLVLLPNDVVYVPRNVEKSIALGAVDMLVRVVTFRPIF